MRVLSGVLSLGIIIGGIIIGGGAHAATPRTARGVILKAMQRSSKVSDKDGPWRAQLITKSGNVRNFRASNLHSVTVPGPAPGGAQGGFHMTVGGIYDGTINLKTNRVTIQRVSLAR
jgi:hypothetical protein